MKNVTYKIDGVLYNANTPESEETDPDLADSVCVQINAVWMGLIRQVNNELSNPQLGSAQIERIVQL